MCFLAMKTDNSVLTYCQILYSNSSVSSGIVRYRYQTQHTGRYLHNVYGVKISKQYSYSTFQRGSYSTFQHFKGDHILEKFLEILRLFLT